MFFFVKKDLSIFFNLDIFYFFINVQFLIYNNKVKNKKIAKYTFLSYYHKSFKKIFKKTKKNYGHSKIYQFFNFCDFLISI